MSLNINVYRPGRRVEFKRPPLDIDGAISIESISTEVGVIHSIHASASLLVIVDSQNELVRIPFNLVSTMVWVLAQVPAALY